MTEQYVKQVMEKVDRVCEIEGVGIGKFWDWLGNVKFREDDGDLSQGRAEEIRRNIYQLIKEYKSPQPSQERG